MKLCQINGQTVPQSGYSIGKCSDSKSVLLLFPWSTRDAKTRLGGEPQMTDWKVAGYLLAYEVEILTDGKTAVTSGPESIISSNIRKINSSIKDNLRHSSISLVL